MPIMKKKSYKKTERKYAKMSEWLEEWWELKKQKHFFILSVLFKWLTMYTSYFYSQEKSKNFKNAVYVVSIFIFSDGWLHISKSWVMLTT